MLLGILTSLHHSWNCSPLLKMLTFENAYNIFNNAHNIFKNAHDTWNEL